MFPGNEIHSGRGLAQPVRRRHRFRQETRFFQIQIQAFPDLLTQS